MLRNLRTFVLLVCMYATLLVDQSPRIIVTLKIFIYVQRRKAELRIIIFSGRKSVAAMAVPAATVPTPMLGLVSLRLDMLRV